MPWDPRHSQFSAKQKMLLGDIELVRVCARQPILVVYFPKGRLRLVSASVNWQASH
jgi:hypothetical protein